MRLIFVVGGSGQGKEESARRHFPEARIVPAFHKRVRENLEARKDPLEQTDFFLDELKSQEGTAVIISDEVGCGIVPMEKEERAFREANGRVNCLIARRADEVYRAVAGILVRIR